MVTMQHLLWGYNIFVIKQLCMYQVYIHTKYERDIHNINRDIENSTFLKCFPQNWMVAMKTAVT